MRSAYRAGGGNLTFMPQKEPGRHCELGNEISWHISEHYRPWTEVQIPECRDGA